MSCTSPSPLCGDQYDGNEEDSYFLKFQLPSIKAKDKKKKKTGYLQIALKVYILSFSVLVVLKVWNVRNFMAELHSQMIFETDLATFVATKLVPFVVN